MKPIVLVGFMGVGKTTVGQLLAQRLDKTFVDGDHYFEEQLGQSVPSYLAEFGEEEFRKQESRLLPEMLKKFDVIATGGGIITLEKTRQYLKQTQSVVYLFDSFETNYARLVADTHVRPLVHHQRIEQVQDLFTYRQPLYDEVADKKIYVKGRSPDKVVEELIQLVLI
ncbi:shikimate kinase [Vagococcus humatus]|uniref:Shikimate kinase n=1 Tax=Vagococcus humatus TaxID=1889241 RepID=A0A429Z6T1_9ENTE|nr:shikimate kinase [Vagococcus humatus]RST89378.1 shikimate kinase [Vagococcus humatus]